MPNEAAKKSVLNDRDEYTAEGVFWIPEGHRWTNLRAAAQQSDIGSRVDKAMEEIERENASLKGVLPKNYTQRELSSETIGGLINTFSRHDLAAVEFKDLDVLGRVYEYFLGKFASKEGKNAGEFYTPRSVVQLLVEMLQPYRGRVFDPALLRQISGELAAQALAQIRAKCLGPRARGDAGGARRRRNRRSRCGRIGPLYGADLMEWFSPAAVQRLYGEAQVAPTDVSVAELYDATSFMTLKSLETYGLAESGQAWKAVIEHGTGLDSRLPVNTHGGFLSEGYIHGMSTITEAVRQLRGTARNQVVGADVALAGASFGSALLLGR